LLHIVMNLRAGAVDSGMFALGMAMLDLNATLFAILLAAGLFGSMLLFLDLGWRFGIRQLAKHGEPSRAGVGKADAPVYALFGLLLGFTFSGAASRFTHRSELASQQVIAITTAWQRVDALPPDMQPPIRSGFQAYVDALIAMYQGEPSSAEALREPAAVARARDDLWARSVTTTLSERGDKARMLLLPSLNEMFSVAESERIARRIHSPALIFLMLAISAFASAVFVGYALGSSPKRNWMYMLGSAATVAAAMYVIIELEYPRLGLLRANSIDKALVELRTTMK
jgi:hypothetical protein